LQKAELLFPLCSAILDSMPVAHIITRSADESRELAAKLRARGYSVQLVAPEQVPDTAADIEITLEECTPEEALEKASSVFDADDFGAKDLCVFIAPGAIVGPRPIAEIPLIPQEDSAPCETPVSLPMISSSARNELRLMPSDELAGKTPAHEKIVREQAQAAEPRHPEPPRNPSEVYVYQDAVLSPLERVHFPLFRWARLSLRVPRRPSFRVPSWSLPHFSLPRFSWRVPRPNLHFPRFSLRLPRWWRRVPRITVRIPRPKLRVPQFELRSWRGTVPARPVAAQRPPLPVRLQARRSSAVFWDTTVGFGILAVCGLLVAGLMHRPASMPADVVERSPRTEQRVRFAPSKTISKTPPAQVTPKSAVAASQGPQAAVQQQKLLPTAATVKPAPAVSKSALMARSKPAPVVRRHRSAKRDADYVAEDVVVHYGKKPSLPPAPPPAVKSDLQ
jgi:hypothetical protein